jgi:hypothetical protein
MASMKKAAQIAQKKAKSIAMALHRYKVKNKEIKKVPFDNIAWYKAAYLNERVSRYEYKVFKGKKKTGHSFVSLFLLRRNRLLARLITTNKNTLNINNLVRNWVNRVTQVLGSSIAPKKKSIISYLSTNMNTFAKNKKRKLRILAKRSILKLCNGRMSKRDIFSK